MDVNTKDLTITTATVTVNAVKIDGKALTVAVYKQIPVKDWPDIDFKVKGPLFGWVRHNDERSVLWSMDGVLVRTSLDSARYYGATYFRSKYMYKHLWQCGLADTHDVENDQLPEPHEEKAMAEYYGWVGLLAEIEEVGQIYIAV